MLGGISSSKAQLTRADHSTVEHLLDIAAFPSTYPQKRRAMNYELPPPATAEKPTKWASACGFFARFTPSQVMGSPKPASQTPPDIPLSDQELPTILTDAEVLEIVNMHKCFKMPLTAPDVEVTDLPNLDDLTQYEVSEEIQGKLWAKEVSRLVAAATTDSPLEFQGSQDLAIDSAKSYEVLASLADQVWLAMNLIIYDGESVLAEHCKELHGANNLKNSRTILDYICDPGKHDAQDGDEGTSHGSREDFFSFVDYCTAVFARVVCATADGKSLHLHILAQLAKISAKLKVVSAKPREFSQISINNGILEQNIPVPSGYGFRGPRDVNTTDQDFSGLDTDPILQSLESLRGMQEGRGELVPASKKDTMRAQYFFQCEKFRTTIFRLLRFCTISLRGTNRLMRTSVTSYEVCAMVYETGFERFRTLVFQDHDNDIHGTSDASSINHACSGFRVLDQAVTQVCSLREGTPAPRHAADSRSSGASAEASVGTRISWCYAPDKDHHASLPTPRIRRLGSMSHVITVIIPLFMTSPVMVNCLSDFVTLVHFANIERPFNSVKPRRYKKYTALFCLTTNEYINAQSRRGVFEAKSLSNALMRRNNLLRGKHITDIGRVNTLPYDSPSTEGDSGAERKTALGRIRQHQLEIDSFSNKMKSWVLEEKGVMVRCKLYVSIVMLVSISIVAGGLAIGLTVQNRIPSVDPFGITTYCWVLAAFIVLMAKSVRVHDWPWNDFLHGRVLCKSVSELSSVTGIKDQLILAKLLQDESVSVLKTRGPFNPVFRRRSDDGFSIDRPLSAWTMLLSGLIMIEVEMTRGRGLVCLDLRRGTKLSLIQNLGEYDREGNTKFIHCKRLPDPDAHHHDANRVRLDLGSMIWMRANGFYANKDAEFR